MFEHYVFSLSSDEYRLSYDRRALPFYDSEPYLPDIEEEDVDNDDIEDDEDNAHVDPFSFPYKILCPSVVDLPLNKTVSPSEAKVAILSCPSRTITSPYNPVFHWSTVIGKSLIVTIFSSDFIINTSLFTLIVILCFFYLSYSVPLG